jgi:aminoglycoside phosphotransferase (APT) family kinase protein
MDANDATARGSTAEDVRAAIEGLLARDVLAPPERNRRAFGNESWRAETSAGRVLLKVGGEGVAGKWRATITAYELAAGARLPVPRVLALDRACRWLGGRTVAVRDWLPGGDPGPFLTTPDGVDRFFASFGRTVARLHRVRLPRFTSRIDGSAPGFDRWEDYVAHRAAQIEERCRRARVMEPDRLAAVLGLAVRLSGEVSAVVRPSLVHRDLHLENVLAGPDGECCGLIDFDCAEAWDPAADLVKPRWQVFPDLPGAEAAFLSGYGAAAGPLENLAERLRVVDILELTNNAANALLQRNRPYAESNLQNLERVLAEGA